MALSKQQWQSDTGLRPKYQVDISDIGEESVSIAHVVHTIRMGDVEDPDLYAGQPLMEWQESEMGKWVMERAVDTPEWHRHNNQMEWHTQYAVVAKLKDVDYTFWTLKWGNQVDRGTV